MKSCGTERHDENRELPWLCAGCTLGSEDHTEIQAGSDLRKSPAQPPALSRADSKLRPHCLGACGQVLKSSKEGDCTDCSTIFIAHL